MDIKLSISLLASNRVNSLKLCLESLKPLLQKVPSELIVVLTSDNEKVREVVSRYADKIIPFTWCDDFSAARNAGLEQAKGEWFLWIDDDEWFEDVTEICDFFLSGEYKNYNCAHYVQKNYQNWNGSYYSDFDAQRLTKLFPESRFENAVHEIMLPRYSPVKHFRAFVHHYGYVQDTKWQKNIRKNRNLPLLLEAVEKEPEEPHCYLQIVQEYSSNKEWEEAEKWCVEGIRISKLKKVILEMRRLSIKYVQLLQKTDVKKGIDVINEFLKYGFSDRVKPCELDRLILYQVLICLYTIKKMSKEAVVCGVEFEHLLDYMDNHRRLWTEQVCAELSEHMVKKTEAMMSVRINSIVSAFEISDLKNAEYFLRRLPWDDEEEMRNYYPFFDELKERYQSNAKKVLTELSYPSPYLMLQRAISSGGFSECMKKVQDSYLQKQLVKEALLQRKDVSEILKGMDLTEWKQCVETVKDEIPFDRMGEIWEASELFLAEYPLYAFWLQKMVMEKRIFREYQTGQGLIALIEAHSRCVLQFYRGLYKESLFTEENREVLPKDCRFAILILDFLEKVKEKQLLEAVHLLRKAAPLCPDMKKIVRELADYIEKEMSVPSANPELEQLAIQMKTALNGMIENHQCKEAFDVVNQLLAVLPDDLELLKMKQNILRRLSERRIMN